MACGSLSGCLELGCDDRGMYSLLTLLDGGYEDLLCSWESRLTSRVLESRTSRTSRSFRAVYLRLLLDIWK